MAKYSQAGRMLAVSTPLGTDVLLLRHFAGTESLSRLFHFELDMVADSTTDIAFDQILGQTSRSRSRCRTLRRRFFNGIVSRFSQGHQVPAQGTEHSLSIGRRWCHWRGR